jgi:Protein of unknown function (DUF2752)
MKCLKSRLPETWYAAPPRAFCSRSESWRWQWVAIVPLVAIGLIVLWAADPAQADIYPRCALHWLTGLHCPGCGSTRAAHALLHGHLFDAVCFNALLVVGGPLAAIAVAWHSYKAGQWNCPAASGRAMLAVLLLFAVARNIPCFPFNVLAPHRPAEAMLERLDESHRSAAKADSAATAQAAEQETPNATRR